MDRYSNKLNQIQNSKTTNQQRLEGDKAWRDGTIGGGGGGGGGGQFFVEGVSIWKFIQQGMQTF